MNKHYDLSWDRLLNPESLKANLLSASIYLSAFEMLKNSIIERIESFFLNGFDENGYIIDEEYKKEVLSRKKNVLYASLDWLKENKAITEDDIDNFNKIKDFRNTLAHELVKYISEDKEYEYIKHFKLMTALLDKVEKWWIINFEIPINADFDDKSIEENGILSGPSIMLHLIVNIALGKEEDSKVYYKEFKNNLTNQSS